VTWLDRSLQRRRFQAAAAWIPDGARLLDLGADDGSFLAALGERIGPSVALDPALAPRRDLDPRHRCVRGRLADLEADDEFDAACALAMFEHLDDAELAEVARGLFDRLRPGGVLVATVPAPTVDAILDMLIALRLVDAPTRHEHHGANPKVIAQTITGAGFALRHQSRFELGLNHLFVFDRPTSPAR
jgi:SAM-dependent methyltransferase